MIPAPERQLNSLINNAPPQIPMKPDLHRTGVRIVCPFRVKVDYLANRSMS
jgi:hypothetical protein